MEKPTILNDYDGKGDSNDHMQLVDDRLSCFNTDDTSKCKLFALTLVGLIQLWFNCLPHGCIYSGTEFRK